MYRDNFESLWVVENGVKYLVIEPEHAILFRRREQLHMTQQQVADGAGIQLRQYQRLESGERNIRASSLRIALLVCKALDIDPYRFVPEALPESQDPVEGKHD